MKNEMDKIKDLPLARFYDAELIDHLGDGFLTQLISPTDLEYAHQLGILIGAGKLGGVQFRSVQAFLKHDPLGFLQHRTSYTGFGGPNLVYRLSHIFQLF
jgi:hypothetical protein